MSERVDGGIQSLPDATRMGRVLLRVADLERELEFYRDILGFTVIEQTSDLAALTAEESNEPAFVLYEDRTVRPREPRSAGLYHAAILMPSRRDLARVLVQLSDTGYPVLGASDHGVSEALYLNDPEGNGLEIYADRPRSAWPFHDGELAMGTQRLDIEGLIGELAGSQETWTGIPAGTMIGHVHLHVGDLARAEHFYCDLLGFSPMQRSYGGALFVSAGGYHHHLGLNIWAGQNIPPAPPDAAGLIAYAVVLPDRSSWMTAIGRLERAGHRPVERVGDGRGEGVRFTDPDGIGVELWVLR